MSRGPVPGAGVPRVALVDGIGGPLPPVDHLLIGPPDVDLVEGAVAAVEEMLTHDPDIDLAYFDSVDEAASTPRACHRPSYSPDRLRAQQYLGEVLLVRRRALDRHLVAGGRLDQPPTADQVESLIGHCQVVAHLPRLLYRSSRSQGSWAATPEAGARPPERATSAGARPLVSVVMPTRGVEREIDGQLTTLCLGALRGLVDGTTYRPLEVVVVVTPGHPADLADRMAAVLDTDRAADQGDDHPTLRVVVDDRPFNFANACNRGAMAARGDVLVFLNDDTEPRQARWLDLLVERATAPDVGAVGARLLYGDGSIQHAGIWSRGGHPTHRYEGFRADHPGHLDSLTVAQNCLAVTGACLAVELAKFVEVGGFCPEFPSSYNDVDLCLKLDAAGYRTVVDPDAVLVHYESSSRDPVIEDWELKLLHRRWRHLLIADPHDNPNHLAPQAEEYPPPDPVVTLERQRSGVAAHPARIWRRKEIHVV